jgi:hypothetical protein
MRAHRAERVRNGIFPKTAVQRQKTSVLIGGTRRVTNPAKKINTSNALQREKVQSSTRIIGPRWVLDIEVWDRTWESAVSSGVAVEVSQIRERPLVKGRHG